MTRALAAAEAGDLAPCLDALLDAWRPRRLAELGAAIDRVSAILNDGLPPGAWTEHRTSTDIGRIAEALRDGTHTDVEARIQTMLEWSADPRIGAATLRAAIDAPFSHPGGGSPDLVALLVRNADERFRSEVMGDRESWKWAQRLEESLGDPLAPTSAEREELTRLDAALDRHVERQPKTEQKFLAQILAAPTDDTPRLVYADWLTERGHPRGELIVLECGPRTPAAEARIRELKQKDARALLGQAAHIGSRFLPAFERRTAKTDRGLVTSLRVERDGPAWWLESPLFWFIEELSVFTGADRSALHIIQASRRLRSVDVGMKLFAQLCALPEPLAATHARLAHYNEFDRSLASWLDDLTGDGLAKLRSFELWCSSAYDDGIPDELFSLPFMANVEQLALSVESLGAMVAIVRERMPKLRQLSFVHRYSVAYRVDVSLDANRNPQSVTVRRLDPTIPANAEGRLLDAVLASLPSSLPVSIEP